MRDLYLLCDFLEENLAALLDAYRSYVQSVGALRAGSDAVDDEMFGEFKRAVIAERKGGMIDTEIYRDRLGDMILHHSNYHYRHWKITRMFFRTNFPFWSSRTNLRPTGNPPRHWHHPSNLSMDSDLQHQILNYLKKANWSGDQASITLRRIS